MSIEKLSIDKMAQENTSSKTKEYRDKLAKKIQQLRKIDRDSARYTLKREQGEKAYKTADTEYRNQVEQAFSTTNRKKATEEFIPAIEPLVDKLEQALYAADTSFEIDDTSENKLKELQRKMSGALNSLQVIIEQGGRNYTKKETLSNGWKVINNTGSISLIRPDGRLWELDTQDGPITEFDRYFFDNDKGFLIVKKGNMDYLQKIDGSEITLITDKYSGTTTTARIINIPSPDKSTFNWEKIQEWESQFK